MTDEAMKYDNLVEMLEVAKKSDKGITFINREADFFLSYKNLYQNARIILLNLKIAGVQAGQELIFQIEKNEDFITLFWACILGGIIPVPVTIGANEEHKLKLFKIFELLDHPFIAMNTKIYNKLEDYLEKKALTEVGERIKERTIFIEDVKENNGQGALHKVRKDDIGLIQFSSGSTGDPKGVILTHENLMTNIKDIIDSAEVTEKDSSFGWMPLTHDLGLIGFHLSPVFAKINQYIMPTTLFITHPSLWFEKTNQYRITVLASPNFGYRHFLNLYKEKVERTWDLSCVRLIFNGAEPISAALVNEFHDKMSKWNLRKKANFPVYGMAEACVAVSFSKPGEGLVPIVVDRNFLGVGNEIKELDAIEEADALVLVDLGYPVKGCSVRICDDIDNLLSERIVGNIQIKGNNVTKGYYNNLKAYKEVITSDGWLKTGDIGFLKNNRLIVTGRKKDIIFVSGQNYYPYDVERIIEEIDEQLIGRVACCGSYNKSFHKEEVVVFILFKGKLEEFLSLAHKIIEQVNKKIGLEVSEVIPIRKMQKTTSGKIQRYKLKELYEQGEYNDTLNALKNLLNAEIDSKSIIIEMPKDRIESKILHIWKDVLNKNNIGLEDNFFEIGGDSMKAAYVINDIYKELGKSISFNEVFEAPTIHQLAAYISSKKGKEYEAIDKIETSSYYELSSAQKRIFAMEQVIDNTSYNISQAIFLDGRLNKAKLQSAFQELIKRNEILRTYFDIVNFEPVQKVYENFDFELKFIQAAQTEVKAIVSSFIKPFDLKNAPLFRGALIEIAEEKHILVIDMHHIISDGTSISILLEEIFKIYWGQEVNLPKLQYRDFSAWQNSYLKSKEIEKSKLYWEEQLKGELPILALPYDYQRPAYQEFDGNRISFEIESETFEKVKKLSAKYNASTFMFFLSVYYILLKKYSNQEDIIVGVPTSGRNHPNTEKMLGMFVNTLPIRNKPKGNKSFLEFLESVRKSMLEAYDNQDYQFEEILDYLKIKRDMSRNPLFDAMFVMENMEMPKLNNSELNINIYSLENKTAKFDLTFFFSELEGRACFEVEYSEKLFKKETIKRLAKHYENILMKVIEAPETKLSDINMLSQKEQIKFIYKYNETSNDYPKDKTIIELIEEQASKTPDNPALIFGDSTVSYEELFKLYNNLAENLRGTGIKRNDIVAIAADRSIGFIVAILAVLKAGAAYLPIDLGYPAERINYMLEDSNAKLLLTEKKGYNQWNFENPIFYIDSFLTNIEKKEILPISEPEDLAYVIYTSGSTGKPKGVMVKNKNLVNYIVWAAKSYLREEKLNFSLYTSVAFDLTITSIYVPLITGNSIVIFSEALDSSLVTRVVEDEKVGIIKTTPAHLALLKNYDNSSSKVKRIIVGGEQLDTTLAKDIEDSFNNSVEIYNEYGPTETTVGCMIYKFNREVDTGASVPIGIPADNVQIYILDKDMKAVPENMPGEMYISGDGVAKGYLGKSELNAQRFLEDPFHPGNIMYRTGDLAKWNSEGNIEFIGRIDQQVKIRGFRIELGEIENQLLTHKLVEQAVVIDKEDSNGGKYLVAYVKTGEEISIGELREYLLRLLPEYMLPAYFVKLESIPLNISGKIDKKNLPNPKEIVFSEETYEAPENQLEELFVEVWQKVLGCSKIGVLDNYFSLGGDSIKAIQIVTRLNQAGIDIRIKDILTYQTIRQCSINCTYKTNEQKYEQNIVKGEFGLPPITNWFIDLSLDNPSYYNQSVLLKWKEKVDITKLGQAFDELIKHHDGLRLNYASNEGKLFYNASILEENFKIEFFDISKLTNEAQAIEIEKIGIELKSGFDIGNKLLLKCGVIEAGSNGQYVLITAHHMVIDGVSWRILLEDLYDAYKALKNNQEIQLPKKTASLKNWYDRILALSKEISSKEIEYWKEIEETKFSFIDYGSKVDYSYRNKVLINRKISKQNTELLLKESHNSYNIEAKDVLIIALLKTINMFIDKENIVIELEGHGRNVPDIDLSRTVGWFTAIYPVKFSLKADDLPSEIMSIKEQLKAVADKEIDYGILKYVNKAIANKQPYGRAIRFNYLGQFDQGENDLYSYADKSTGSEVSISNYMSAAIEINCMVVRDKFQFELCFNKTEISIDIMEKFADDYIDILEQLIDHVANNSQIFFTPSDFELAEVNQEDLDNIFD